MKKNTVDNYEKYFALDTYGKITSDSFDHGSPMENVLSRHPWKRYFQTPMEKILL